MPSTDDISSSLHTMTLSKSCEGTSSVVWTILKEDCMLGGGTEVRHADAESEEERDELKRFLVDCAPT